MEQLNVRRERVIPEASLHEDLGGDSLDDVEIGLKVEETFEITISDEMSEKIRTVGDIYEVLGALLPSTSVSR